MSAAAVKPPGPTMQPTPSKPRAATSPREPGAKRSGALGPLLRVAISIVIVWHFTGIFLAAMSIDGSSDLVTNLAQGRPMQWYLDLLYLNQGHSFFAPNVGPSGVIHYELFDQSGRVIQDAEMPNRKDYWPRLRYHRHFMLADQVPPADEDSAVDWPRTFLEAYGRQILRAHPDAQAVRVRQYAHWPLYRSLEELARKPEFGRERAYQAFANELSSEGITVDAHGYQLIKEVTQRRSDLGPEDEKPDQSNVWQSGPVQTANRWSGGPR